MDDHHSMLSDFADGLLDFTVDLLGIAICLIVIGGIFGGAVYGLYLLLTKFKADGE